MFKNKSKGNFSGSENQDDDMKSGPGQPFPLSIFSLPKHVPASIIYEAGRAAEVTIWVFGLSEL